MKARHSFKRRPQRWDKPSIVVWLRSYRRSREIPMTLSDWVRPPSPFPIARVEVWDSPLTVEDQNRRTSYWTEATATRIPPQRGLGRSFHMTRYGSIGS